MINFARKPKGDLFPLYVACIFFRLSWWGWLKTRDKKPLVPVPYPVRRSRQTQDNFFMAWVRRGGLLLTRSPALFDGLATCDLAPIRNLCRVYFFRLNPQMVGLWFPLKPTQQTGSHPLFRVVHSSSAFCTVRFRGPSCCFSRLLCWRFTPLFRLRVSTCHVSVSPLLF